MPLCVHACVCVCVCVTQVREMCSYLGVDPDEDPYVLEVAHMAVNAPLPEGWSEGEDNAGHPLFT